MFKLVVIFESGRKFEEFDVNYEDLLKMAIRASMDKTYRISEMRIERMNGEIVWNGEERIDV